MMTFYIIVQPATGYIIKAGRAGRFTYNVQFAKKFVSKWYAEKYLAKLDDAETFIIKKIER